MAVELLRLVASVRTMFERWGLFNPWKILAIVFALLNLKNLPFGWHIRLVYGLLIQIRSSHRRLALCPGPSTLFRPLITTSYTTPLDVDYNLHKSNSTYFNDSDVGRLHLAVALFGKGVEKVKEELKAEAANAAANTGTSANASTSTGAETAAKAAVTLSFGVALGGISAHFRREIKPFERFEVWTRILTWDNKWLYMVQHFVKKGAVRKGKFLLQPEGAGWGFGQWFELKNARNASNTKKGQQEESKGVAKSPNGYVKPFTSAEAKPASNKVGIDPPHPAIFASIIAKYVFKQGRRTIPPERVLRAAELLPSLPNPESIKGNGMVKEDSTHSNVNEVNGDEIRESDRRDSNSASSSVDAPEGGHEDMWTWEKVEKERLRGLQMADHFAKLDGLSAEFPGDDQEVLGFF